MRLLLTGTTSLTGAWFARACTEAGIEVHGTLRSDPAAYGGSRRRRIRMLDAVALHSGVAHGSGGFADLIRELRPDVVGYHAFPMEGFRGRDYDVVGAIRTMTEGLDGELAALAEVGAALVYTGTVYEPGPVAGPSARAAVSPYGVAKAAVFECLRFSGAAHGVPVHRFVIPNPFGPLEEGRFGNHLAAQWASGDVPVVRTPDLIRDNIPVQALAECYAEYAAAGNVRAASLSPSGYVEAQGAFAQRVAREIGSRLGFELRVDCRWGAPSDEPLVVVGEGLVADSCGGARDAKASRHWDEYADFLAETIGRASSG